MFLILTVAAAGMATLLALLSAAGHDQLWFLLMAQRHLAGATIYGPQIFDSNPPGIVWLSAIPVSLAHALHLSTTFTAKLLVILAESSASLVSFLFLRRARPLTARYELPALLFAAFVLFYLAPARDFGQRDQILSFLVLPYLFAAAVDSRRHRLTLLRSIAALMAATGICLKPHHALILIAVELTLLLFKPRHKRVPQGFSLGSHRPLRKGGFDIPRRKPWDIRPRLSSLLRPEPLLILVTGLLFLAAIHHVTPLYFTLALPTLHDTYWAIGNLSFAQLLWQAVELCILAAITTILFIRSRPRSLPVAMLLIAGAASTLAYLIQGTGWYYQQLPAIAFFGVALTLQLLDLPLRACHPDPERAEGEVPAPPEVAPLPSRELRANFAHYASKPFLIPATAALSILALALTTHFAGYPFTSDRIYAPVFADASVPDPDFFTPNTSVAILTTSVEAAMMPVDRYHLTWAQRTNNLWLLPAILRAESFNPTHTIPPARLAALDAMQHRWMIEDLTRWQPQLILVERCQDPTVHCQELEDRHDNLLAWFQRDPAFAAIWSHYKFTASRAHFDAYKLITHN